MATIYELLPDAFQQFDVIIAGGQLFLHLLFALCLFLANVCTYLTSIYVGGTAACVVAGRLAEADPNLCVLIIEQGPNNFGVSTVVHPALCLNALMPTSHATIFYQAVKEHQLADRELVVPSGGTLGGGSSINLMMYSRPQRSDFNAWQVPGWTTDDMIPYLEKVNQCFMMSSQICPNSNSLKLITGRASAKHMVSKALCT
jgi:choline dehydrogenase-like flavoprotein